MPKLARSFSSSAHAPRLHHRNTSRKRPMCDCMVGPGPYPVCHLILKVWAEKVLQARAQIPAIQSKPPGISPQCQQVAVSNDTTANAPLVEGSVEEDRRGAGVNPCLGRQSGQQLVQWPRPGTGAPPAKDEEIVFQAHGRHSLANRCGWAGFNPPAMSRARSSHSAWDISHIRTSA